MQTRDIEAKLRKKKTWKANQLNVIPPPLSYTSIYLTIGHLHDGVEWLQLPECFASILDLLALGYWQSILVFVVTQRQRQSDNESLGTI